MPEHPLYVAFVWHMHQPFYRDMLTGAISLPWVRMHAARDYLHMLEVLAEHPRVHLTINMVPSLTDQMLAWAEGREADELAYLAEQESWTAGEQRTILNLAFSVNWDKIIRRYGRYAELLDRRPQALADLTAFTPADYRDLLAWFNLAWIDPNKLERDPTLAALVAQGRGFTVADIQTIHAKQREIAAGVLPLSRELAGRGQLELITSPYYHPILPLLADTGAARRASPGLPLPALNLSALEDVAAQLKLAVAAHTRHFGAAPRGLWPSEGAVSPEILPLVTAAGFTWLAGDEAILGRSLGRPFERDGASLVTNPRGLYQPYRTLADAELGPTMIFRDHELSDRIGFLYYHLPAAQAAEDLIYRLLQIRGRLADPNRPYLVSIILDGENCWEYYEHNGDPFLHALYGGIKQRRELQAVTVSEYLADPARRPAGTLAKLATGSWIGSDLTTWIGDPEHTVAWEALARTRAHLVSRSPHPPLFSSGRSLTEPGGTVGRPAPASEEASSSGRSLTEPGGSQSAEAVPTPPPHPPFLSSGRSLTEPGGSQSAEAAPTPPPHPPFLSSGRSPTEPGGTVGRPAPAWEKAWQALFAAEGSDWFWWFSHRNRSDQDALFDCLFRHNLMAVYAALGDEPPAALRRPITEAQAVAGRAVAAGRCSPALTAAAFPGEAWALAAAIQPAAASSGTMQRADALFERLFVGHDDRTLSLRLDLRDRLDTYETAIYLGDGAGGLVSQRPQARYTGSAPLPAGLAFRWQIARQPGQETPFLYRAAAHDQWESVAPVASAHGEKVLEIAVPLTVLGLKTGEQIRVFVTLARHGEIVATLPEREMAAFVLQGGRGERGQG